MFRKTRNRIMLLNMVMVSSIVIAAFTVIFVIIYTQEQDTRRTKLMYETMPAMTVVAGAPFRTQGTIQVEPGIDGSVIAHGFARRIEPGEGVSFSLLLDGNGNLIEVNSVVNLPETAYGQVVEKVTDSEKNSSTVELEGRTWQYYASSVTVAFQGTDDVTYYVSGEYNDVRFLDVTDSDRMLESLGLTLLSLMVVILAAFFFISRLFANKAVRPMEDAFDRQSRFVADASHELKTPLSVINANCGVLYANKEEPVASQQKWVDSIVRAADRMTDLTDNLLSLARLEDKEHELQVSAFDLSSAVAAAVSDIEQPAQEKELQITTRIEPDIQAESDRGQILNILGLLLDNAVKYTDAGGEVIVSLQKEKRRIVCTIRNSGQGIPPEDLPRLFDRFYRGDPARSSGNGGYGLGLAIAKAAANRLKAELTVSSEPGQYTEFCLRVCQ